ALAALCRPDVCETRFDLGVPLAHLRCRDHGRHRPGIEPVFRALPIQALIFLSHVARDALPSGEAAFCGRGELERETRHSGFTTNPLCSELWRSPRVERKQNQQAIWKTGGVLMLVRSRGLEPPRVAPLAPQASASTNSATTADGLRAGRSARHGACNK